jgi:hypothetical protein
MLQHLPASVAIAEERPTTQVASEPRSDRAGCELPDSVYLQARQLAAQHAVSVNEVVIHCLHHGLADEGVLEVLGRDRRRRFEEMGPSANRHFLLPTPLKQRLLQVCKELKVDQRQAVVRCLQHGIGASTVHAAIATVVASRTKKLGRTVSKEDVFHAA